MTYFHPSNLAWKAAGRAVRPLIKNDSQRSSVAGKEATRTDAVANLKDQREMETRQRRLRLVNTGRFSDRF